MQIVSRLTTQHSVEAEDIKVKHLDHLIQVVTAENVQVNHEWLIKIHVTKC